jgi:UDP-N-acetylglucosamine diphosphorylase / glucose-1-phosphate thymidylyltransferase / UDP-N-acetylgalactosamine diphosphorylase / glucosamine-1-phosphate N-acetyltransferase / galactosamine-1-phosphate N-acetyltransferase
MIVRPEDLKAFLRCTPPAMALSRSPRPQDYGTVVLDGDRVTGLDEKSPKPRSDLINAGAYLLDEGIFGVLESLPRSPRGEYELTDALAGAIAGGTLRGHHLTSWMDAGYPWDLLEANREMLEREEPLREGIIEEGVQISGSVSVGEGTVIRAGTVIEGPCAIGKGCRIGPHAYLRGATSIGDRCHIGHASEVKNSVILTETNLPHFNYVADSIVGSRCNFGAGTKIANLRHDHGEVVVCGRSTGRTKFGAVVGDGVLFGINCSVNTGTVVGAGARVAPHAYLHGCIDDGTEIR